MNLETGTVQLRRLSMSSMPYCTVKHKSLPAFILLAPTIIPTGYRAT